MVEFTEEARREFIIKRFEDFPDQVIALAWLYAVGLAKFGVDLSKEWATVTQKRSELDLAYRMGRRDEQDRWVNTGGGPRMSKCDDCGITPGYEGGVFCTNCKPLTNADRIRSMSDEELAWELCRIQRMPFYKDDSDIDEYEVDCWAKWLQEEGE